MKISPYEIYKNSQLDLVSKKSFGEVFTPDVLIEEMLDTLPTSIWGNPSLIWLDPAAGVGNFFAIAYNRLMVGLKSVIKNDAARSKHILEKMFYFVELQEKNVKVIHKIFNPDKKVQLNVFSGDFETLDPSIVFGVKKFDVVVGNPPYQSMYTSTQRKAKNHNLWSVFIKKGFDLLQEKGFLLYVTPPAWMSPSSKLLQEIFLSHQLHFVNINECSRHFKGIGSQFSYYLIQKTPTYTKTKFVYDFKGGSQIKSAKGTSSYLLNPNIKFIPQLPTPEAFSILEKTVFSDKPKYNIVYDSDLHKFTRKDLLSSVKDKTFKFKIMHTPTQVVWGSRPHKYQNRVKVFVPLTTYYERMAVEICGNTQGMGYLLCDDYREATSVRSILLTRLYRFVANITRWSNFNVPLVMKNLPQYPNDEVLDEESINSFFKLSKKEVEALNFVQEIKQKPRSLNCESQLRLVNTGLFEASELTQ
jgi:hypothetical protein